MIAPYSRCTHGTVRQDLDWLLPVAVFGWEARWDAECWTWTDETIFGPILVFPSPLVGKWFPKHGGVW